jgi:hypothetical protein
MRHRHLHHQRLTLAALDDLIENGTLADWRPVLARVRRDPDGPVAARLAELLGARDYEESGALWRTFLDQVRARRLTVKVTDPSSGREPRKIDRVRNVPERIAGG